MIINETKSKILPIGSNPLLHGYAHYSYSMAIICNSEVNDKKDIIFNDYIDGFNILEKNYICHEDNIEISEEKSKKIIDMHAFENPKDKHLFYYNKISGNGTYIININYFKHLNVDSECGIMISKFLPEKENFYINDSYRYFYCGERKIRSSTLTDGFINLYDYNDYSECKIPIWLSITKFYNNIIFKVSYDGIDWKNIHKDTINLDTDEFYIGTYVEYKTFTYFNWLYNNYIQLHCDKYLGEKVYLLTDVVIDMFNGFRIRGNYYLNNPFLFTECIEKREILTLTNINNFICNSVNDGKYIQIMLNERYVPNTSAYEKYDFIHISLIYGYDKDKAIFYLMGYDKNGHIMFIEIPFDMFLNAVMSDIPGNYIIHEDYIMRITPLSPVRYNIEKDLIVKFLQDYLNGENSYNMCSFMQSPPERIFGINLYKCFCENFRILLNDKRILHIFLEHKYLMLKRVSFLHENNIIPIEDFEILFDKFNSIYIKTEKLRNMMLKLYIDININNNDNDFNDKQDTVCNIIDEIKNDEIIAFELLIKTLKQ